MSDPDIAPEDEELLAEAKKQRDLYVSHSTYNAKDKPEYLDAGSRRRRERADYAPLSVSEPVPEHPIIEHKHPKVEDDLVDDGGPVLGADLADDYKSRSTYVLEPSKPKTPHLTRHRHRTLEDIAPEDKELLADVEKTGEIYKSQSTHEIGEMGSVILEKATKLREKSVQTLTEGKPIEGLGEYLTGVALSGGVSFIRGAAYVVNPLEWARSARDLTYLAKSRYAQKQFVEQIAEDPFSFAVDTGSAIAGGWAAGKLIGKLLDTPDEIKYDIPEKELSRTIKRTDGRISPREYDLVDIKKDVLHKVAGWDEVPVAQFDDLGSGFSAYHPKRGSWPKPTKGYWAKSTGEGLIMTESMIIPTSKFYKPRIDYLSGFEGLSPLTPNLSWMQTISSGRRISAYPFMGMGAIFGLSSKATPDIYDPLGIEKNGTLQKSTPKIDDTGLGEIPKIIERVDETYKPKPDLVDPITIFKPIHDPKQDPLIDPGYEPYPPEEIPKIIERLDEDTIPVPVPPGFIQKLEPEPKQDQPPYIPPFFPEFLEGPTQKPPRPRRRYKEPDEKLIDKALFPDLFGLKKKTSRIATPQESFMGMLFGGPPEKKKRKRKKKRTKKS